MSTPHDPWETHAAETSETAHAAAPETAGRLPEVPGYEVLSLLGQGGMGVVYRARHVRLGRTVALKMLDPAAVVTRGRWERFQAEARAAAQLQHANIAQLYEAGEVDGRPWYAMELVEGGALSDQLAGGPQPPRRAAETVETLARAVHYSHEQGIVHRDLKPANVLVNASGHYKISDFGLARLADDSGATRTGDVLGTPSYMSPEQARGDSSQVGPAADIYSLGAVLYELLTGRPPFQGPDPLQTLKMVVSDEPLSPRRLQPSTPRDLETICLKCLEKSPRRRYASAEQLADELRRFLDGVPIQARPVPWWERSAKWTRRHPTAASVIGLVCTGALLLLLQAQISRARLARQLDETRQMADAGRQLANWLLFDHSEALKRMSGSTAVREAFAEQLLEYLHQLEEAAPTDERFTDQLASAWERIAEVLGDPAHDNLGRTADALDCYRNALALRERLVAQHPGDAGQQLRRLQCRRRVAVLLRQQGDDTESDRLLERTYQELQALRRSRPDYLPGLAGLLGCEIQLCRASQAVGQLDQALQLAESALQHARELIEQDEEMGANAVANCHGVLGSVYESRQELALARSHYQQMLEQSQDAAPHDRMDRVALGSIVSALIGYGDVLTREQEVDAALESYRQAKQLQQRLVDDDPHSIAAQQEMCVLLDRIGAVHSLRKQYDLMQQPYREMIERLERLAADDVSNVEHQHNLMIAHNRLGEALAFTRQLDEADSHLQQVLEIYDRLPESVQTRPAARQVLAEAYKGRGLVIVTRPWEGSSAEEVLQSLHTALDWCRRSQRTFEQLAAEHSLTPDQQRLQDVAEEMIDNLQQTIGRLRELEGEPSPNEATQSNDSQDASPENVADEKGAS